MTVYTRNQPVGTDDFDISQPFLTANTNAADNSFGVDHYPFSNLTASNGFHNTVTQPAYNSPLGTPASSPPTTTTNPIIYAFQQTSNVGVLQFSRGPNNVVPTPVTSFQSPVTPSAGSPGSPISVLNFSGINVAIATMYAYDSATSDFATASVFWNGGSFHIRSISLQGALVISSISSTLQITFGTGRSSVYWTLQFLRMQ